MNRAILSGRIIGPIYHGTGRTTAYYKFRLECEATSEGRWPDRINCVAFGDMAARMTGKQEGEVIALEGRISTRSYDSKDPAKGKQFVTEVVLSKLTDAGTTFTAAPGPPPAARPPGRREPPPAPRLPPPPSDDPSDDVSF